MDLAEIVKSIRAKLAVLLDWQREAKKSWTIYASDVLSLIRGIRNLSRTMRSSRSGSPRVFTRSTLVRARLRIAGDGPWASS